MIGQEKLQKKIYKYDINTFPRTNLLIGEYGCGKHLLVEQISKHLNIAIKDISLDISKELIDSIYLSTEQLIYIIDINKLATKQKYITKENSILKFIEEPPKTSIICILAQNKNQILDTIINRSIIWNFTPYTLNELLPFKVFTDEKIYKVLNTPGKLLESNEEEYYEELFSLCSLMFTSIQKANISNTLSLEKYLSDDKFSFELLLSSLSVIAYSLYLETSDEKIYNCYLLIKEYEDKISILNVNKLNLFNSFILKFKNICSS